MNYQEIMDRLSPCGIRCDTCFAYKGGEINELSKSLSERMGNFQVHAKRFAELLEEPVFNVYPYFQLQLDYFKDVECEGCRKDNCKLFKSCRVRSCTMEKNLDFCFQCDEFPCSETGFDENLELRWKQNNLQMKEKGVEAFFQASKDQPRYK